MKNFDIRNCDLIADALNFKIHSTVNISQVLTVYKIINNFVKKPWEEF